MHTGFSSSSSVPHRGKAHQMSIGTAVLPGSVPTVSPSPPGEPEAAPLDWLLVMLHDAMSEVQASDAPPMQKASAIARLGNLYLKTYRAAGLERTVRELKQRVAELEASVAAREARSCPSMEGAGPLTDQTDRIGPLGSAAAAEPLPPSGREPSRQAVLQSRP